MPRLPKSTWDSIRNLYVSGVSLGEIHRQTGVKKGTLCARAAREKWSQARQDAEALKQQVVPYDPDVDMVRITSENARETRRYMSEYLMKAARKHIVAGSDPTAVLFFTLAPHKRSVPGNVTQDNFSSTFW